MFELCLNMESSNSERAANNRLFSARSEDFSRGFNNDNNASVSFQLILLLFLD